jgi:magnesium-transporting ATPase (P-type)
MVVFDKTGTLTEDGLDFLAAFATRVCECGYMDGILFDCFDVIWK